MTRWRELWRARRAPGAGGETAAGAASDGPGIGAQMREVRRARGLSLGDAERDTRISRHYLEAIEDEDFRALPAPVYARGFMRAYAKYLGMDPEEAAAGVPRDLPRPIGLEPMPGLRRSPGATLPALRPGVVVAAVAAVAVVALLLFVVPRIGGGDGIGVPIGGDAGGLRGAVPPFRDGEVPDLVGAPRDVAVALLDELGLESVVIEAAHAEAPAGEVFHQSPAARTAVDPGDVVTVFVSRGATGGGGAGD